MSGTTTQAQIEAAARAMFEYEYDGEAYSWNAPERSKEKDFYCALAKAALTAAAEVGEQTHLVSEIHRQHKEIERLRAEIQWLRAALQRIVDSGESGGFAYGIAFAAIRALKDKP